MKSLVLINKEYAYKFNKINELSYSFRKAIL